MNFVNIKIKKMKINKLLKHLSIHIFIFYYIGGTASPPIIISKWVGCCAIRIKQTQYNSEELYFTLLVTSALKTLPSISQNRINEITLNNQIIIYKCFQLAMEEHT